MIYLETASDPTDEGTSPSRQPLCRSQSYIQVVTSASDQLAINPRSPQPPLYCLVTQACPTLCNSRDYSPPGSSVHGVIPARIMEWVAIPFFRGFSQPRNGTQVSCIAGEFFRYRRKQYVI